MTTVYFVRHAEPDKTALDDRLRPLTAKGQHDTAIVTDFLRDKNIDVVLSSPYKRAMDTVLPFANSVGLKVIAIEDFREREAEGFVNVEDFNAFKVKQWADFNYKTPGSESLFEVQKRNMAALDNVLSDYNGKNIVIGTHGTALSTILNYYDNSYGYDNWKEMSSKFPWIVKMSFNGNIYVGVRTIDMFK